MNGARADFPLPQLEKKKERRKLSAAHGFQKTRTSPARRLRPRPLLIRQDDEQFRKSLRLAAPPQTHSRATNISARRPPSPVQGSQPPTVAGMGIQVSSGKGVPSGGLFGQDMRTAPSNPQAASRRQQQSLSNSPSCSGRAGGGRSEAAAVVIITSLIKGHGHMGPSNGLRIGPGHAIVFSDSRVSHLGASAPPFAAWKWSLRPDGSVGGGDGRRRTSGQGARGPNTTSIC